MLKNRGAKLWGIDPAKEMLEIAKSEIKGVDFKVGNASKLPYDNGFFDIVVAGLVIGYFKDLDKAFNEVNRVLKNGGIFVFSMTNPLLEVSEYDKKNKMCRKFNDYFKEGKAYANWPTFGVRIPYYHRTLQTIIRATIRSGFTIKDFVDAKPQNEARKVDLDSYLTYSKIPHFSIFKVRKTQ
jgi:ubiquinone/menaquinone biosynthesis C-methylase UbiE